MNLLRLTVDRLTVSPVDVTSFFLIDNKKLKISKLRADSDATFDEKCNFMRLLSFYAEDRRTTEHYSRSNMGGLSYAALKITEDGEAGWS